MEKASQSKASIDNRLKRIKLVLEILALPIGAVFLSVKLFGGEADAAMQVSLDRQRQPKPGQCGMEFLTARLGMQRSAVGRLELTGISLEVRNALDRQTLVARVHDQAIAEEATLGDPAPWVFLPRTKEPSRICL